MNISQLDQGHQGYSVFLVLKLMITGVPTILTRDLRFLTWGLGWTSRRRTRFAGLGNREKEACARQILPLGGGIPGSDFEIGGRHTMAFLLDRLHLSLNQLALDAGFGA